MAQQEHDREDLLAEATALVERAQLKLDNISEPVVVGFRRDGSASFFFGGALVYQFNTAGQLRRAFADGLMFKAENGRLASLRRERTEGQVTLARRDLSDADSAAFLRRAHLELANFREALRAGHFQCEGQVPAEADIVGRIVAWFEQLPESIAVAASPRVG